MDPSPRPFRRLHSGGKRFRLSIAACLFLFLWVIPFHGFGEVQGNSENAFPSITGPCYPQFPRDHGEHAEHRTEWWYYTGNLTTDNGSPYGFQLTFFRSRMRPAAARRHWPPSHSAWRTSQLYLAHAALTDIKGGRFFHAETLARGALDMAGVRSESTAQTIFVRNWTARIDPEAHRLHATADEFSLDLILTPVKPPVAHGVHGYSLKGSSPERASCYYSLTRLRTVGTLSVLGTTIPVQGESWMDHEYSSAPLEQGIVGWDWFSLQLSNGSELMVYFLREQAGTVHHASSGTFVPESGERTHLRRDEIRIEVLDHWTSRKTGARYPSSWRLKVPALDLDLLVTPNHLDQELITPESTRVTYWEGSVNAGGTMGQRPVRGHGYVELTGYAHPLDARF